MQTTATSTDRRSWETTYGQQNWEIGRQNWEIGRHNWEITKAA